MNPEARRSSFFQEMDKLRGQARRPEPTEIFRLALKAGFTGPEALRELNHFDVHYRLASGEQSDVLPMFISALCGQSKSSRILEYVNTFSLPTSHMPEQSSTQQFTLVTPDPGVAEMLRVVFEGTSSSVVLGIADLPNGSPYQLIICNPAIGYKPAGDRTADGFGGEIGPCQCL